jgi:hypothetical protein
VAFGANSGRTAPPPLRQQRMQAIVQAGYGHDWGYRP